MTDDNDNDTTDQYLERIASALESIAADLATMNNRDSVWRAA